MPCGNSPPKIRSRTTQDDEPWCIHSKDRQRIGIIKREPSEQDALDLQAQAAASQSRPALQSRSIGAAVIGSRYRETGCRQSPCLRAAITVALLDR